MFAIFKKTVACICVIGTVSFLICGCSPKQKPQEKYDCAKCGKEATTTLSGPREYMEAEGIDLSKCKSISGTGQSVGTHYTIYTAHVCKNCLGRVAD